MLPTLCCPARVDQIAPRIYMRRCCPCCRGASPPALSPRSPPPPLLQPFAPEQPQPARSGKRKATAVSTVLIALTALAALGTAVYMADWPLAGMLRGGASGDTVNSEEIGAGCANIDALEAFNMSR